MPRGKVGGKYDRRMSFDDVKDERMLMMVDKLCVWMGGILEETLNRENLIPQIRNGVLMCRLATVIQESVDDFTSKNDEAGPLPRKAPQNFSQDCSNRSMEARENVMKFLTWARELRVPESSIFSPDDLLKLKGKMNVVNTLLAVARRAKDCGMAADIDAPPKIANAFKGLEEKFGKKFEHTATAFGGQKSALKSTTMTLSATSAWKVVQQKIDLILQLRGKPSYEIFRA
ncbi:hypothetical protein ACHWQZ_G006773 [Mnemiopsis leidyi]